MARQKKIVKYVPQSEMPTRTSYKKFMAGYKFSQVIEFIRQRNTVSQHKYYDSYVRKFNDGILTDDNAKELVGEYNYKALYEYAFPMTDEFKKLNDAFLAEYDSREDLQEIYKESMSSNYHCYRVIEGFKVLEANDPFRERPETFIMFRDNVNRDHSVLQKIELARPTPYQEGDLVLLRDTSVGNADYDPLYVSRYNFYHNGQTTPDKSVQRIGTVISVTDKISNWRASKGSKTIKVMWIGVKDGQIFDIPERHLKWHERPTLKNGLKTSR